MEFLYKIVFIFFFIIQYKTYLQTIPQYEYVNLSLLKNYIFQQKYCKDIDQRRITDVIISTNNIKEDYDYVLLKNFQKRVKITLDGQQNVNISECFSNITNFIEIRGEIDILHLWITVDFFILILLIFLDFFSLNIIVIFRFIYYYINS